RRAVHRPGVRDRVQPDSSQPRQDRDRREHRHGEEGDLRRRPRQAARRAELPEARDRLDGGRDLAEPDELVEGGTARRTADGRMSGLGLPPETPATPAEDRPEPFAAVRRKDEAPGSRSYDGRFRLIYAGLAVVAVAAVASFAVLVARPS